MASWPWASRAEASSAPSSPIASPLPPCRRRHRRHDGRADGRGRRRHRHRSAAFATVWLLLLLLLVCLGSAHAARLPSVSEPGSAVYTRVRRATHHTHPLHVTAQPSPLSAQQPADRSDKPKHDTGHNGDTQPDGDHSGAGGHGGHPEQPRSYFSLPIFFIIFRETFEASLIVSILLAFLRRTFGSPGAGAPVYQRAVLKKYTWHIVFGTIAGLAVSMALGLALLYLFYTYSANLWANGGEFLWEGVFCAVSAVVIAVMGVGMMGKGFAVNVVGIRSQPHGSAPTSPVAPRPRDHHHHRHPHHGDRRRHAVSRGARGRDAVHGGLDDGHVRADHEAASSASPTSSGHRRLKDDARVSQDPDLDATFPFPAAGAHGAPPTDATVNHETDAKRASLGVAAPSPSLSPSPSPPAHLRRAASSASSASSSTLAAAGAASSSASSHPDAAATTPLLATTTSGATLISTGSFRERYAFFFMPFLTVLREGLEGMVFIGGVATSESPSAIPGAAVAGAMLGTFLGWILFRTGLKSAASSTAWHVFFLASTACLLLVAAGLVARSVQFLSSYHYALILRANSPNAHLYPSPSAIPLLEPEGLGEFEYDLFDPRDTLWALGFGNPENPANGGWLLANAMLGWFPRGSVRTVAAYMGFWLLMAIGVGHKGLKLRRIRRRRAQRDASRAEYHAFAAGSALAARASPYSLPTSAAASQASSLSSASPAAADVSMTGATTAIPTPVARRLDEAAAHADDEDEDDEHVLLMGDASASERSGVPPSCDHAAILQGGRSSLPPPVPASLGSPRGAGA